MKISVVTDYRNLMELQRTAVLLDLMEGEVAVS